MSKKNRRKFQLTGQHQAQSAPVQSAAPLPVSPQNQHAAEYRIIRNDLIRVAVVNAIFLAAILLLYSTNLHSNYLEHFYDRIF